MLQNTFISPVPRKVKLKSPPKETMSRPSEEMYKRWQQTIKAHVPSIDLIGTDSGNVQKRQFAPEYSQSAYDTMIHNEFAIGNYTCENGQHMTITAQQRRLMIAIIEDLHRAKGYKEETLLLAVSVADRYLVNLTV